jgi:chromosome partitioning protein
MTKTAASIVLALWGKGGAGKTSTAIALAGLAAAEGRRTVVLDADPQRSASEFHTMSRNPTFNVHSTEVGAVATLLGRAKLRYDAVIIDNPPAPYRGSHAIAQAAGISIICARPFRFDLTLALEWVDFLKHAHAKPLVALIAAPPLRHGMAPPTIRLARERLKAAGATPWRHQITHRLIYPELIFRGMTVADLPIDAPARSDYARLWSAICERNN